MTTDKTQGFHEAYRVLARSLLLRASGFQSCPTDLLDQLLADAEFVRLAAQEPLIRRGERVEHLMLVLEGVLHARISLGEGRSQLLAFLLPGMSFGYLSFIDGGAMPHDLVAHTPAVALRMPVASVRRLSLVWHELMEAFQMQLAQRLRAVYDALIYNKAFSLRERVVMQVVALADWVGLQRGERVVIELPMSQTDLADLVGAGRQAVNAELQRLQALGLVRVGRAHVDVLDLEGLRANLPSDMPPLQLHLA